MRVRLSPSAVESYRLFLDTEWMTRDRLVAQIQEPFKENLATCVGTTVHKYIELGDKATPHWWADKVVDPDDIIEVPRKLDGKWQGFRVLKRSVDEAMANIFVQLHEIKDFKEDLVSVWGDEITLTAKADGATGMKLWEWKTTSKSLQMGNYRDSVQAPLTMMVLDYPVMEFVAFQMAQDKKLGHWYVKNSDRTGDIPWSDTMEEYLMELLNGCISFYRENGLEHFLHPWEDVKAAAIEVASGARDEGEALEQYGPRYVEAAASLARSAQ